VLAAAIASPAAAARKSTNADTGLVRVVDFANGDVWDSWGHFYAEWDKVFVHEDGINLWHFSYMHMAGALEDLSQCPWHFCTGGASSFKATFLTSSGSVVTSFYLPVGYCGLDNAWPGGWGVWNRCRTNFDIPYSATQIRFNWLLTESTATGSTIAWSQGKTVAI
jgi:hypothetical protein